VRRVSVFSTAIVVSGALVSAALAANSEGDVARRVPFACVVSLVWLVATWAVAGPLVAVVVGGVVVAVGSLTVAVYVVGFEPIPVAECGVPAEELSRRGVPRPRLQQPLMVASG
jgi:hypothetical protein